MILLLSTYELGRPPLGLAQPAAFLRRAGLEVEVADLAVEPVDDARLRAARLVGVSVPMHTALRLALPLVERVRRVSPGARVVAYGLYAPLCEGILRDAGVDAVLGGEHEEALVRLALATLADGETVGPEAPASAGTVHLERLSFPPPAREGLAPLSRYAKLLDAPYAPGPVLAAAVEASRGCRHLCTHCPIPPVYGGRFFVVPQPVVLEDVRRAVDAGARHITFADADFFNGPTHSMAIARALATEHPGVTFDVTIKVEHLLRHRRLLPELGRLGCAFLVSAVESLSDRVLALLDKGHTRADAEVALALVEDAGIAFRPTFVPFTPWSTLEDYLDLLAFIDDHALHDRVDPVQLGIRLLVPPGSLLLAREATRRAFGPLDASLLGHRWQHPDPRMDELQREVAAQVEAAAEANEPPRQTFARLRALAERIAGRSPSPAPRDPGAPARRRGPRLSEPWFC